MEAEQALRDEIAGILSRSWDEGTGTRLLIKIIGDLSWQDRADLADVLERAAALR
jgi:hypothetical protein